MEELSVPLDAGGFSRRECPRCQAQFKLRWSEREASVLAAALARRVRHVEAGGGATSPLRTCPYCACAAPADAFLTPDVQRQLDAEARVIEAAVRQQRLRVPVEWLAENPRAVRPPPARREARAVVQADASDDLLRIALPCCGEEHKVSDAWLGPIRCHLCGIAHLRAGPRDIGLELALLRQWTER